MKKDMWLDLKGWFKWKKKTRSHHLAIQHQKPHKTNVMTNTDQELHMENRSRESMLQHSQYKSEKSDSNNNKVTPSAPPAEDRLPWRPHQQRVHPIEYHQQQSYFDYHETVQPHRTAELPTQDNPETNAAVQRIFSKYRKRKAANDAHGIRAVVGVVLLPHDVSQVFEFGETKIWQSNQLRRQDWHQCPTLRESYDYHTNRDCNYCANGPRN